LCADQRLPNLVPARFRAHPVLQKPEAMEYEMTFRNWRIHLLAVSLLAVAAFFATVPPTQAHHGWRWTKDGKFQVTGSIVSARLGNPHGVVKLRANGVIWTIEVGQPWRNRRAGLTDAMFAKGRTITVIGSRSAKASERVVKAIRIRIARKNYDLYPERL